MAPLLKDEKDDDQTNSWQLWCYQPLNRLRAARARRSMMRVGSSCSPVQYDSLHGNPGPYCKSYYTLNHTTKSYYTPNHATMARFAVTVTFVIVKFRLGSHEKVISTCTHPRPLEMGVGLLLRRPECLCTVLIDVEYHVTVVLWRHSCIKYTARGST